VDTSSSTHIFTKKYVAYHFTTAPRFAADAGLKARQPDWPRFTVATAVALLKPAPEEHADAVARDRIAIRSATGPRAASFCRRTA
jgi:hypothetical protein